QVVEVKRMSDSETSKCAALFAAARAYPFSKTFRSPAGSSVSARSKRIAGPVPRKEHHHSVRDVQACPLP
ncbi:MAG: hypothetical protein J7M38_02275, partial [Armatimonadetes bacterium]|nr:hypothetical protein [Armatimonadota bacterium]